MTTRGIRGATTISSDSVENIIIATQELLNEILALNPDLNTEDIASVIFTTTADISSAFPALAARKIGWDQVPLLNAREIPVPDSLPFCIRVLIFWNTKNKQNTIQHVYLGNAIQLRPDLISAPQPNINSGGSI